MGEEAQAVALVLVGPQVVRALGGGLAGLVDKLSYLLAGGRVAEYYTIRPGAEVDLAGQAQVVVHDAADALVGVAGEAAVRVVGVLLRLLDALFLKVPRQRGRSPVVVRRPRQLVARYPIVDRLQAVARVGIA